jgi:hypothetical protein
VRTANRILSVLLGLGLTVLGISAVIDVAWIAANGQPVILPLDDVYRWLTSIPFDDGRFLTVAILAMLAGLVLLVLELKPWRPDRVRVAAVWSASPWWVSRRSVERRTMAAAQQVGGASHATSRVRGKGDGWRLRVRAEGWPGQRPAVVDAVHAELARLDAPPGTSVDVSLRTPRRRVA